MKKRRFGKIGLDAMEYFKNTSPFRLLLDEQDKAELRAISALIKACGKAGIRASTVGGKTVYYFDQFNEKENAALAKAIVRVDEVESKRRQT